MADITSIINHLGGSIDPVTSAITALSFLIGFMMIWKAIKKMKTIADSRARYTGGGRVFIPVAYFLGGAALFFLPTMLSIAKNTVFGAGSPLAYGSWIEQLKEQYGNSSYVVTRMVQLAGLIWFVRGIVLLVYGSEPGVQHGSKGLAFVAAGVLAVNVSYTYSALSKVVNYVVSFL